jgi:hypothetical protein
LLKPTAAAAEDCLGLGGGGGGGGWIFFERISGGGSAAQLTPLVDANVLSYSSDYVHIVQPLPLLFSFVLSLSLSLYIFFFPHFCSLVQFFFFFHHSNQLVFPCLCRP